MGWQDLLEEDGVEATLPWVGEREIRIGARVAALRGKRPHEQGWYRFRVHGREAEYIGPGEPNPDILVDRVKGYLVGDLLLPDDPDIGDSFCPFCKGYLRGGRHFVGRACGTCHTKTVNAETVFFAEELGLGRFSRIEAGRLYDILGGGSLIAVGQIFPLGPEAEVCAAYEDRATSTHGIKGVTPALDAAFQLESWHRLDIERRRAEAERRRLEEEARRAAEERRAAIVEQLGDAAGRREMAKIDFGEAAKAALAVGGAEYLDHRHVRHRNEYVVRFRLLRRRFECVCDQNLRIIDSGICLIDHATDIRGDTWFTLESLPGVIQQAEREHRLVIFRHAD